MKGCVLAIELSTANGSVAVADAREVLFDTVFRSSRSHNASLFGPLSEALEAAGDRLSGVVVGTGPGSYTGVRIAIAAAQGIALSRDVLVLGLSSLGACADEDRFGVLGDARRGRYYVGQIHAGHLTTPLELLSPQEAGERVLGSDLAAWFTCEEREMPGLPAGRVMMARPSAVRLTRLALAQSEQTWQEAAAAPLEPSYLEEAFITRARK